VIVIPDIVRFGQELELASDPASLSTDVNVVPVADVSVVRDGEFEVAVDCDQSELNVAYDCVSTVVSGVEGPPVSIWFKHAMQIR
jgi:hypothetical protein